MVSIWMLCALRSPGSERHKAPQACPRPRAPRGPPAGPQRQARSAVRPSPAAERALGRLSCGRRTQRPRGVGRSLRLAKEGASWASPGACQVLHN